MLSGRDQGRHPLSGLVDIGANLAHESFAHDLDTVLARATQAGVTQIIVTGSSLDSSRAALKLAQLHPGRLFATAGLHPHHASDWTAEMGAAFRELRRDRAVVALGECGLDYFRNLSPPEHQRRAFAAQLALAAESRAPLFLHQRDAHSDFHSMLREHRAGLGDVVVHCFTDTRAALADYLALDCHIGITGWICDPRRGGALLEAVPDIPDERLLVETDAPYLRPQAAPAASGRRNEPALLPYVVASLAVARGQSAEQVARISATNARRMFGLSPACGTVV
ncbi:MAG TPA: TatD family hydrolase [Solimonas sp.]|nr:TatD family hydrolase [Solimonas sp.]